MFNNALEHSEGTTISIGIERTAYAMEMIIPDNGS